VRSVESPRTKLQSLSASLKPSVKQVKFDPLLEQSNNSTPDYFLGPVPCLFRVKRSRNAAFDLVGVELNPGPGTMVPYGSTPSGNRAFSSLLRILPSVVSTLQKYGPDAMRLGDQLGRAMSAKPRLVGIESNPGPRKKTGKRAAKSGKSRSTQRVAAAQSMTVSSTPMFSMSSKASFADCSMNGACRIQGTGLLVPTAKSGPVPAAQNGVYPAYNGNNSFGVSYVFTTKSLDSRVATIGTCFNYYVIRRLRIEYVPAVPSSTAGTMFMAISDDFDLFSQLSGGVAVSPSALMQFSSSVMSSVWNNAVVTYSTDQHRVYHNDTQASGIDSTQLNFVAATDQPTANMQWGYFRASYVVDFYDPVTSHATF